MSLIISDIMSRPPVTVGMDQTVEEIQSIFDTYGFHHITVEGEDGRCVGAISDRDLLRTVSPFIGKMAERVSDLDSLNRRAHQVMTRQLISVRENTLVRSAARLMLEEKISCVPVVDGERRCIGMVTIRDIVQWAVDELGCESTRNDGSPPTRLAA